MKQIKFLMLMGLLACGCLTAQTLTSIQVGTTRKGPIFFVDGTAYTQLQTFQWPVGSKHVVQFLLSVDPSGAVLNYQNASFDTIRYVFGGWVENTGLLIPANQSSITVTADPSITSVIATVTLQYHVQLLFNVSGTGPAGSCQGAPGDPAQAGLVSGVIYLDGNCYSTTTNAFLEEGVHSLNAFPYPGWVFFGWNINGNPVSGSFTTFNLNTPTIVTPQFSLAKRVQFLTNPPGLTLLVDRTTIQTPLDASPGSCTPDYARLPLGAPAGIQPLCVGQVDFLPTSKHQIGAATPQQDKAANYWVFAGFSNGLGQNSQYTADSNSGTPDIVIGNFNPGAHATFTTNPGGLQLQVDGKSSKAPYNAIWGVGETHQIFAPAQQTDSHGRAWVFANWSNGGAASQTVTEPAEGLALAANYKVLGQVQVTSVPVGLTFNVDGKDCVTPCVVDKGSGAQVQVTIPSSISSTSTTRFDFVSWSDGSTATTRQVDINQDTVNIYATYQAAFLLTTASNPAGGAAFKTSPESADGFYATGTQVTVTATPKDGYKFVRWEGDLSGAYASGTLTMSTPHAVIADLVSVPFIPPAGIQTAAGPTPDGSVGPGSIISIYGNSLAAAFQVGPTNPLAQTIGDVTVTVNGQLLPLLFVSPDQIAAQLPWELADGDYTLQVHALGQPDVPGKFTVSRDAPAIFTYPETDADPTQPPLLLALHEDGSVITRTSPARHNEQISIYGTGFGPYDRLIPAGFSVSTTDNYKLVDPVQVTVDTLQVTPAWAGPATSMVGMNIVKLKITDAMPSATTVNLTVAVNGKTSSPVALPLQ